VSLTRASKRSALEPISGNNNIQVKRPYKQGA
jgi:hypothetical protein